METACIDVEMSQAECSNARVVIGSVCVHMGTVVFPSPEWSDVIVVVLRWWAEAAAQLVSHESSMVEVRFMEGPYLVRIESVNESLWHLDLIEARLRPHTRHAGPVPSRSLVSRSAYRRPRNVGSTVQEG